MNSVFFELCIESMDAAAAAVAGGADRSYGIYVAQLAGLPGWVLERSQKLLTQL